VSHPDLRASANPQVQQTIRDTLRNRKEQLLEGRVPGYRRDEARDNELSRSTGNRSGGQAAGCGEDDASSQAHRALIQFLSNSKKIP